MQLRVDDATQHKQINTPANSSTKHPSAQVDSVTQVKDTSAAIARSTILAAIYGFVPKLTPRRFTTGQKVTSLHGADT